MEADTLLRIANRVQAVARRAENLVFGWETRKRISQRLKDGTATPADLVRVAQYAREKGYFDAGNVLFWISHTASDEAWETTCADPTLKEIGEQIKAVEVREGLGEDEEFIPDHPDVPQDWKALNEEYERRWNDVYDRSFHDFLRRYGEDDIADLYLNNRPEWDRLYEEGRFACFGPIPDPDEPAAETEGDTPSSQVIPKHER